MKRNRVCKECGSRLTRGLLCHNEECKHFLKRSIPATLALEAKCGHCASADRAADLLLADDSGGSVQVCVECYTVEELEKDRVCRQGHLTDHVYGNGCCEFCE